MCQPMQMLLLYHILWVLIVFHCLVSLTDFRPDKVVYVRSPLFYYPLSLPSPSPLSPRRSSLAERFSMELPGLSLPQVLSTMELPRQMAELKATYTDVRPCASLSCIIIAKYMHDSIFSGYYCC